IISVPRVSFLNKTFFGRVTRMQALSGACFGAIFSFVTAPTIFFSATESTHTGDYESNLPFFERPSV
ncbi:hypothetical protein PMAYCL1PPCAC_08364, partial [Pristionchus mayeri]